jgi:hypothetical protein
MLTFAAALTQCGGRPENTGRLMSHVADLPHLDDVRPLDATDGACLAYLHAVLARHGKEERFGVGLLHRHFDLAIDERLVETMDEVTRTLTTRPVNVHELPEARPSTWQLAADVGRPEAALLVLQAARSARLRLSDV